MYDKIKKHRLRNKLKQQDLAKYLDIPLKTYRSYERTPHLFNLIQITRLCELFETDIKDLYDDKAFQCLDNTSPTFKWTDTIEYHDPEIDSLIDEHGYVILYKYRPFDAYVMDNITKGLIYMPYVMEINDPFETLSYLETSDGSCMPSLKFDPFVMASFSNKNDSPVMWTHYAKNYTGICLEVKINVTRLKELGYLIGKVAYSDERTIAPNETIDKIYQNKCVIQGLFRKKSVWSYESEYRVFKQIDHGVYLDNDYSMYHTNGKVGKARNPKYYLKEATISKIILGHHIRKADYTKIKSWSKNKSIPLYRTYINTHHFCLEVVPLDNLS